jgi:hypothetical protein
MIAEDSEIRAYVRGAVRFYEGVLNCCWASKLLPELVEVPVLHQDRIHGVKKMRNAVSNGLRMIGIFRQTWSRMGA